ncbi:MurR/RpiR family transcriptional regulator [Listeria booriae]|uniref:MurR/RpiR family transcriptional regulator n=1 Tax=Listeria booriae TaxID=1552123 RepID=UPI00162ABC59|nr:MurR/RpiR family transcriptional regulator [Listeria booriae]MBC1285162.1 MurR/RpiR family transcriptional regulator [Listeria booriae]
MGSVINRIQGMLEELPKSEAKVGRAILDDPSKIVKMSIHELAECSGASGAAVIRFCHSMGLEGFPELKMKLSVELVKPEKTGYYDIEPNEDFEEITRKLVSNTVQTLNDTVGQLDREKVWLACDMLQQADTIYAYGVGASWLIAEDIAQKWMRAGKHAVAIADPHILAMAFAAGSKNALFFAISNSGETSAVLQLADEAQNNGLQLISLTRFGQNKLKQKAGVALETSRAPETELRSAATSSRQAQFLVIDILFYFYASHHYEDMIEQIRASRAATNRFRES